MKQLPVIIEVWYISAYIHTYDTDYEIAIIGECHVEPL